MCQILITIFQSDQSIMESVKEKSHKCYQCSYASPSIGNLKRHENTHRIKETNKCNHCEYVSSSVGLIRRHMKKHLMNKCNECDYVSSSRNEYTSLRLHMKIHGEKIHKCNECDFAAFQPYQLKVHMKKHLGDLPYKCSQCD